MRLIADSEESCIHLSQRGQTQADRCGLSFRRYCIFNGEIAALSRPAENIGIGTHDNGPGKKGSGKRSHGSLNQRDAVNRVKKLIASETTGRPRGHKDRAYPRHRQKPEGPRRTKRPRLGRTTLPQSTATSPERRTIWIRPAVSIPSEGV